jgi:hypothetical protein
VAVAGDYAALVNEASDLHYGGGGGAVAVFDLRTGTRVANAGGESAHCPAGGGPSDAGCSSGVDQLVVGADGATAAHTFISEPYPTADGPLETVEQVIANDSTGTHVLDSITTTGLYNSALPALSDLALSRETLTWSHAGTQESARLN